MHQGGHRNNTGRKSRDASCAINLALQSLGPPLQALERKGVDLLRYMTPPLVDEENAKILTELGLHPTFISLMDKMIDQANEGKLSWEGLAYPLAYAMKDVHKRDLPFLRRINPLLSTFEEMASKPPKNPSDRSDKAFQIIVLQHRLTQELAALGESKNDLQKLPYLRDWKNAMSQLARKYPELLVDCLRHEFPGLTPRDILRRCISPDEAILNCISSTRQDSQLAPEAQDLALLNRIKEILTPQINALYKGEMRFHTSHGW